MKKYGYVKTGVIPALYKIEDNYVDFDIMSLDLRKKIFELLWEIL